MLENGTFKRAVVHIGVHKTGTKSIQRTLHTHRSLLAGAYDMRFIASLPSTGGVWLYSRFCDTPHRYPGNIQGGHDTPERAREINRRRSQELDSLLAEARESTLVLSEEDLSFLSPAGVRRFKRWIDGFAGSVSVILFLREPLAWATSRAQQALREKLTLEQVYANPPSFNGLADRLAPWLEAFGLEAIHVTDYDDAKRHPDGIIGTFCELSGIPLSFAQRVDTSIWLNASLSVLGARLLSELNLARPYYLESGINRARAADDHLAFERVGGRRFRLPPDVVERVIEESRQDCAWVARNLGLEYALKPPPESRGEEGTMDQEGLESLALLICDLWRETRP